MFNFLGNSKRVCACEFNFLEAEHLHYVLSFGQTHYKSEI